MAWLLRNAEVLASVVLWEDATWPSLEGALLLEGPAVVHTLRSRVPLDVAWCLRSPTHTGQLKVCRVAALGRRRLARPCGGDEVVVAAAGGAFERWHLQVGDTLEVEGA